MEKQLSGPSTEFRKEKKKEKLLWLFRTELQLMTRLSTNPGDYLEKNLKKIVKFIEDKSNIEILAIGIGHDVSRYYSKAIKIADVQELGDVMIDQLSNLFSKKTLKSLN